MKSFKEVIKNNRKHIPLMVIFSSISLLLNVFILVNAGLDGSKSGNFSSFISTIISNIINAGTDVDTPKVDVSSIDLVYPDNVLNKRPGYANDEIPLGGTKLLTAKVEPLNATNRGVIFSSNSDKVKITQSGLNAYVEITEIGADYKITATSQANPELKATYDFRCVELKAPYSFDIEEKEITIYEGLTYPLDIINTTEGVTYEIVGDRYYNKYLLNAQSLDISVVSVQDNLVLKGNAIGDTTVKVSNNESNNEVNLTVHVVANPNPIVPVADTWNIVTPQAVAYIGDVDYDGPNYGEEGLHHTELTIDWGVNPPSDKGVIYSSSNPLVAMVDNDGFVRGYRNTGVATIRATSTFDPSIYKEIDIEVKKVDLTSLTLAESKSEIEHGSFLTIAVSTAPINATDKSFSVSSSDKEILEIVNNGSSIRLYGNKSGTATITLKSNSNPELTVTREFTITPKGIINDDNQEDVFAFLRKSVGHFSLFLISGVFTTLAIFYIFFFDETKRRWLTYVSSLLTGFMVAGISELIQLFTPGRSGLWADVGIDTLGYLFGGLFVFLFFIIYNKIKARKEEKKQ